MFFHTLILDYHYFQLSIPINFVIFLIFFTYIIYPVITQSSSPYLFRPNAERTNSRSKMEIDNIQYNESRINNNYLILSLLITANSLY
jgi:hypothetical protein